MIFEIKIDREDFVEYVEEKLSKEILDDMESLDFYEFLDNQIDNGDYDLINEKNVKDVMFKILQEKVNEKIIKMIEKNNKC